jgi:hypothetical protein
MDNKGKEIDKTADLLKKYGIKRRKSRFLQKNFLFYHA